MVLAPNTTEQLQMHNSEPLHDVCCPHLAAWDEQPEPWLSLHITVYGNAEVRTMCKTAPEAIGKHPRAPAAAARSQGAGP
jgi:hypothetical protein